MSVFLQDLIITLFTIGSGIVFAGLVASFYQLATNHFPKFSMADSKGVMLFTNLAVIVLSGPIMLIRNSYYARVLEGRPMIYVVGGAMVAGAWGMVNGIYILNIILNLP